MVKMKQHHYYNGTYPTYSYISTYIMCTIAYKTSLLAGKYLMAEYWFNVMLYIQNKVLASFVIHISYPCGILQGTETPKYMPKIINMQNHL